MVILSHNEFTNDSQPIEIQPSLSAATQSLNAKINEINM